MKNNKKAKFIRGFMYVLLSVLLFTCVSFGLLCIYYDRFFEGVIILTASLLLFGIALMLIQQSFDNATAKAGAVEVKGAMEYSVPTTCVMVDGKAAEAVTLELYPENLVIKAKKKRKVYTYDEIDIVGADKVAKIFKIAHKPSGEVITFGNVSVIKQKQLLDKLAVHDVTLAE